MDGIFSGVTYLTHKGIIERYLISLFWSVRLVLLPSRSRAEGYMTHFFQKRPVKPGVLSGGATSLLFRQTFVHFDASSHQFRPTFHLGEECSFFFDQRSKKFDTRSTPDRNVPAFLTNIPTNWINFPIPDE